MIPTTQPAQKIAKLFNRRLTTPWSDREIRIYKKLYKAGCFASMDDLALIERYYAFERRKGDKGIHRRDLFTFLNNYAGELDRATAWQGDKRPPITRYQPHGGAKPCTESEFERIGELARKELQRFKDSLSSVSAQYQDPEQNQNHSEQSCPNQGKVTPGL